MIHLLLTPADARRVSDGVLDALVDVGQRVRRMLAGDLIPVIDPPGLTVWEHGNFVAEYYHEPTVARLKAAIEHVLRTPVTTEPEGKQDDVSAHSRSVMHSSKDCDWGTPPAMFHALDALFKFGIDVAASAANAQCETWCGPDHEDATLQNGLKADWRQACEDNNTYDVAFMNPPYSRELKMPIEPWIEAAYHWSQQGMTVVGIVPAAVQTRWWQQYARRADAVWFIPHRVAFVPPPGRTGTSAGVNTAVVVWRPSPRFIGHAEPAYRYWTYRTAGEQQRPA